MKNKIVLWGTDAADERILVALELKIEDNKVMVYTFPEKVATDEFYQLMMDQWRNNAGEVAFPEGHQSLARELSISEELLPDEIKVERTDLIQRAQTEWHFVVLSSKLSHAYKAELQDLEEKLASLREYDKEIWSSLKQFWGKVQQQMQDRTLLREHADELRSRTNKAFDQLKTLRSKMDEEFRKSSKDHMDRFEELLNDVEERIKENKHVTKIFDELKGLQKELRDIAFTRDHRNKLWQRIDTAFKEVKEKRFGSRGDSGGGGNSPVQRITSRYNGLMNAIDKMERSIKRDDDDLEFQQRKINRTDGQLEAQIRQAKIQMIEQRVNSKREKLEEMLATKIQLEAKIEKEKERQVKREAQAQKEAARQEAEAKAKEKIAEDIRRQQENLATEGVDLTSAAEAINEQKNRDKAKAKPVNKKAPETPKEASKETTEAAKEKPTAPRESLLGAIGTTLSESLEDVMDTVKAVAEVVSQQIEDKVEEIKHDFAEATKSEEE
jgi:chromosome segregation ATPase